MGALHFPFSKLLCVESAFTTHVLVLLTVVKGMRVFGPSKLLLNHFICKTFQLSDFQWLLTK